MEARILVAFDYNAVSDADRSTLRMYADEIRERNSQIKRAILTTARTLTEAQERLARYGKGTFQAWVEAECEMSVSTAYNLINVHKRVGVYPNFGQTQMLDSVLYLLAAPGTPDGAITEAMQRAENGERITVNEAKRTIRKHKLDDPDLSDEERAYERERDRQPSHAALRAAYTRKVDEIAEALDNVNERTRRVIETAGGIGDAESVYMLDRLRYQKRETFDEVESSGVLGGEIPLPEVNKRVLEHYLQDKQREHVLANSTSETFSAKVKHLSVITPVRFAMEFDAATAEALREAIQTQKSVSVVFYVR